MATSPSCPRRKSMGSDARKTRTLAGSVSIVSAARQRDPQRRPRQCRPRREHRGPRRERTRRGWVALRGAASSDRRRRDARSRSRVRRGVHREAATATTRTFGAGSGASRRTAQASRPSSRTPRGPQPTHPGYVEQPSPTRVAPRASCRKPAKGFLRRTVTASRRSARLRSGASGVFPGVVFLAGTGGTRRTGRRRRMDVGSRDSRRTSRKTCLNAS
jgi:hypothetical protein